MSLPFAVFGSFGVSVTEQWTRFSWGIYDWFTNPWRVVLPLLPFIILPFFVRKSVWRRRLSQPLAALLLLYLVAISPPVASLAVQGLVHFVPADSGNPSDAIVVLSRGGETSSRYELALKFWQADRAPQLFVTGTNEVIRMLNLLKQKGISSRVLEGTACNMTTNDEATSTAAILGPQGVKSIILITDPPHMLRAFLTFRSLGFSVIPHMTPLPNQLNSTEVFLLALREYTGLLSYTILGRFWQQPEAALESPTAERSQTIKDRGCKVDPTKLVLQSGKNQT